MGYTHYWQAPKYLPKTLLDEVQLLIDTARDKFGIEVKDTVLTESMIRFDANSYCETFVMLPGTAGFCKTNHHPCDRLVVAVLIAAAGNIKGFQWDSDGDAESGSFDDAGELINAAHKDVGPRFYEYQAPIPTDDIDFP